MDKVIVLLVGYILLAVATYGLWKWKITLRTKCVTIAVACAFLTGAYGKYGDQPAAIFWSIFGGIALIAIIATTPRPKPEDKN